VRRLPLPLFHATKSEHTAFEAHPTVAPEPTGSASKSATSTVPTKLLVQSGRGIPLTVADALRLLPVEPLYSPPSADSAPAVMTLMLLFLPSSPLDMARVPVGVIRSTLATNQAAGQQPMRVTTYDQLNRAHPKEVTSLCPSSNAFREIYASNTSGVALSSRSIALFASASQPFSTTALRDTSTTAPSAEHRPSRPAAHPKERISKARKAFAGLRRGNFLAPAEEKDNRSEVQRRQRAPVDSPPASPLGPFRSSDGSNGNSNNNNDDANSCCKQISFNTLVAARFTCTKALSDATNHK